MPPDDGSSARTLRRAAKVLLIDEDDRVLLFCGGDPGTTSTDTWWFPVGGGADDGEKPAEAARREVFEETGLELADVGPQRFRRVKDITFNGEDLRLDEDYFLVFVEHFEVDHSQWTDLERKALVGFRWWSLGELRTTTETVFPEGLAQSIAPLLRERPTVGSTEAI